MHGKQINHFIFRKKSIKIRIFSSKKKIKSESFCFCFCFHPRLSLTYDEFSLSSRIKTHLSVEDSGKVGDDIDSGPKILIGSSVKSNDGLKTDNRNGIASSWYDATKLKTTTTKLVQTDNAATGSAAKDFHGNIC